MCCTTEEKRIEEKRVEEKNGEFLCPLSRSMQYNFALDDYIESAFLLCPCTIFRHGNKKYSFPIFSVIK
jgi:hypothetical protein